MLILLNLNVAGYIDPSVMTYAIQAIAGVIIAVGAFLGIYLRKAKKKLNNFLVSVFINSKLVIKLFLCLS